jgi:polyisoprenoid-binding protein YceI
MKVSHLMMGLLSLVLFSCAELATAQATAETIAKTGAEKKDPPSEPVSVENGKAALTPQNTTIQFVGMHTGDEPKPRTGYFSKFKGEFAIDQRTKSPTAASVDIETKSLITPIGRLTSHLQSPDFFDVEQFPKASFKATKFEVTDAAAGKYKVTGELTLRDVKKPISFPAVVKVTDKGAVLASQFKLKRSEFGITFGPDRIEEEVTMTITVGKSTPKVDVE